MLVSRIRSCRRSNLSVEDEIPEGLDSAHDFLVTLTIIGRGVWVVSDSIGNAARGHPWYGANISGSSTRP